VQRASRDLTFSPLRRCGSSLRNREAFNRASTLRHSDNCWIMPTSGHLKSRGPPAAPAQRRRNGTAQAPLRRSPAPETCYFLRSPLVSCRRRIRILRAPRSPYGRRGGRQGPCGPGPDGVGRRRARGGRCTKRSALSNGRPASSIVASWLNRSALTLNFIGVRVPPNVAIHDSGGIPTLRAEV
jgi:hypothetical protein